MSRVVCAVDHTRHALQAVRAAVERCRRTGADLELVGVVEPFADAPAPASGERVRRFELVQGNLVRAVRSARAADVETAISLRSGDRRAQALDVARATGAGEVFFVERRGRLVPRSDVVVVAVPAGATREPERELVAA